MIAAIYARKSTEQNVSDDAKSVTRQIEHARAFADERGWAVIDEYVDDGVSGALSTKLAGRARMLADAAAGKFNVLIVRDVDRLSRDDRELSPVLILDGFDIEVWEYSGRARVDTSTALNRGMLSMKATFAAAESEAARRRTREAMHDKASDGHVAGGTVYGYRNVRGADHVTREVVAEQAAVIRRIFGLVAEGRGFAKVAKALNAEHVPCPRGRYWAMSGVRAMVFRELYRGRIVYGRKRNQYRNGKRYRIRTPESEWITVESPGLRVVPEELWLAAHARLDKTRQTQLRGPRGRLGGRPVGGGESRYLLSGLVVCGECGGSMHAIKRTGRRGAPRWYYTCNAWRVDGACTNSLSVLLPDLDVAVLKVLRDDVLTPDLVEAVVTRTIELARLEPEDHEQRRLHLATTADRLRGEIARLTDAIAGGAGTLPSLVAALKERERDRADVLARLEHLDGLSKAPGWNDGIRDKLRARLTEWRGLMGRQPEIARQVVRKLLAGRLTMVPDREGRRYSFTGQAAYDAILAGIVTVVPPGGSDRRYPVPFAGAVGTA